MQAQEDKKREDMRESLNFESESKIHNRIAHEADWRNSIAVGDYLDALAQYKTPSSNQFKFVLGWAHAKVLAIDEKNNL